MKESEFPDLELCKQIGHLFPKPSHYWLEHKKIKEPDYCNCKVIYSRHDHRIHDYEEEWWTRYPAPTVCEMLERLPAFTIKAGTNKEDGYTIERDSYSKRFHDKSIANALAKLLIHLDKEGLL